MARKRSIASLSVTLTAKVAAFQKSMKKAMASVTKFAAGIKRVTAKVAKMGFAISAVATGAMALFIKQSFASLDALAKFSDQVGINANKLRALQRAASLTGADAQALNSALNILTIRLGRAAIGGGAAMKIIKELGLNVQKLLHMPAEEALLRIIDVVNTFPSRTRRLGILADFFSNAGAKLINLTDLGTKKIREMLAESVRLSGSLTRFDLFKIEAANDAFADMKRSLRSIADFAAIRIAPLVEKVSKNLTERFISIRKRLPELLASAKSMIVRFLNFIDREFRLLIIGILKGMETVVSGIARTLSKIPGLKGAAGDIGLVAADLGRRAAGRTLSLAAAQAGDRLLGDRLAGFLNQTVKSSLAQFNAIQAEISKRAFRQFFEGRVGLRLFSTVAATAATAAVAAATGTVSRARLGRPLTALQISPSRTFVPGLSGGRNKAQLVVDPATKRLVELILEQNRLLQQQFFGVTS